MVGRLIVFEGLDGSGISTQAAMLRNHLVGKGKDVILTKEPTDGLVGGIIKSCLRKEWKTDPLTLQILFAADRSHHLTGEIEPALKKNKTVICDRYILSSLAFGSLSVSTEVLKQLNSNFMKPHITIVVDTHPKICIERMQKGRHHVELFEEEHKLTQIRQNMIAMKKQFPDTFFVDGNRTPDEVHADIKKLIGTK